MSKLTAKTTVYLNPKVKKSIQYYALRDDRSLSDIIDERLHEYLEDMVDIKAIEDAKRESSEFISFEDLVNDLGLDINEIQNSASKKR